MQQKVCSTMTLNLNFLLLDLNSAVECQLNIYVNTIKYGEQIKSVKVTFAELIFHHELVG